MWLEVLRVDHARERFTPTRAGTMLACAARPVSLYGSPPHPRGRLDTDKLGNVVARFTPTCVGTTSRSGAPCR